MYILCQKILDLYMHIQVRSIQVFREQGSMHSSMHSNGRQWQLLPASDMQGMVWGEPELAQHVCAHNVEMACSI